jgi:hypothetical protein
MKPGDDDGLTEGTAEREERSMMEDLVNQLAALDSQG